MDHWGKHKMSAAEHERAIQNNRRVALEQTFRDGLNAAQKRYFNIARRTARLEKEVRKNEKGGTRAFTASLRMDTATRLNQTQRGLKSANLDVIIARGWLYFELWELLEDLATENAIQAQQISIMQERGEEE